MGINRFFFDLVLDELYEELCIVADNEETLHRFSQLQNEAIATRVQRLYIAPKFLSGLGNHHDAVVQTTVQQTFRSVLTTFMGTGKPAAGRNASPKVSQGTVLLATAEKNIRLCSNIRELKIVLRDQTLTCPFKSLLKSLWHPESIAPRLKTLTLESTPAKLAELLGLSLYKLSNFMTSLEHLDISFSVDPTISDASLATNFNFKPFFGVFKHKLNSLSTSGLLLPHLFDLYKNVPTFTALRKLEIYVIVNVRDLFPLNQVSRCIMKHANTLEHLVLKSQVRHLESIVGNSNSVFIDWLTLRGNNHGHQTFSSLVLPHLRIMELGLRDTWVYWNIPSFPVVFPDFARVTPALRELTIADAELPFSRLCELVDCLPTRNGQCTLELLKFHTDMLSPELMDLLAGKVPGLKSLELHLSVATETMAHGSPIQFSFCETIRSRSYPRWKLQHLRITSTSFCGKPHPNIFIMKAVAATLADGITLATSYRCDCDPPLN